MTSTTTSSNEQWKRGTSIWKSALIAASRTALACIIVGSITLFGPATLRRQVAFPAFSYVTVILIITNATLGDTVRGCWHATYATVQGVCPAILCLWIVGPTRLTAGSTSLVVAITAFFVALPQWTHLVAKRIALGQIVIVYVIGYINGGATQAVMHPVHVAASTAVGAFACVLAFLLPYPLLASSEVKQNSKLLAENASDRMKLFVKAFWAEDSTSSQAFISQAKSLASQAKKFLHSIKSRQESMQWERIPIKCLRPYCKNPGERLQELETPLRGMEIALSNSSIPASTLNESLKDGMKNMEGQISQNLEQIRTQVPSEMLTVPESNSGHAIKFETLPSNVTDLPSYFFFFCMKLLHTQSRAMTIPPKLDKKMSFQNQPNETDERPNGLFGNGLWPNCPVPFTRKRLVPALKCSLSLGFAVFFGLHYSKPDGYWAGLPVAISLAAAREPTFKVTNVKAQGTVIGTVYGVLGCFVFERFVKVRFLALLPWFIFTSFLQRSKMYGQAGGVSAVIGAVLILGRKNFGPPSEFAIARIVETFIGLSCSIIFELLLQPTRASSLAKVHLLKTLEALRDSLSSIDLRVASKARLLEREKLLRAEMSRLRKFADDAEAEPNFWFLPFNIACYGKLIGSFSKIADLLHFAAHAIGYVEEQIEGLEVLDCKEGLEKINGDLELVGRMMSSLVKCFQEIMSIKSLVALEKELMKKGKTCDLELGKSGYNTMNLDEKEMGKVMSSFLDHSKEVLDKIDQLNNDQEEVKSRMVMSLSALGFCLSCLMKETKEVEKGIRELVQWENPTSLVNLKEISCKIHALHN